MDAGCQFRSNYLELWSGEMSALQQSSSLSQSANVILLYFTPPFITLAVMIRQIILLLMNLQVP